MPTSSRQRRSGYPSGARGLLSAIAPTGDGLTEEDRIRYLHNQSTNDFQRLKPGLGCDTVIVTSTARTIDLVTAYVLEDAVLLLVSPNRRQYLMDWLDRYIFADRQLTDVTDQTATFSLIDQRVTPS